MSAWAGLHPLGLRRQSPRELADVKTAPDFHYAPRGAVEVDARALARALKRAVAGEVRFSNGSRGLYATAGSNYRQLPLGVVIPKSKEDVLAVHRVCAEYQVPIFSRGGGTSLAGQCCNTGVVMDFSKYLNRVLEIDVERRLARVEPGVVLDVLRQEADQYGLTFGPDPSTHSHCTLGGMIGNNSCGVRSVMAQFYGPGPRTSDNVHELEVVTYDGLVLTLGETTPAELERRCQEPGRRGEIYRALKALAEEYGEEIRARYPNVSELPRRVSGYNLDELLPEQGFNLARALSGTESTCVTYLEATVHLIENPPCRSLLVLGYPDKYQAADAVPAVLKHRPQGLEGVDDTLAQDMTLVGIHDEDLSLLPEGKGWLLVEFGGQSKEEADAKAEALMADLDGQDAPAMKLYDDKESEAHVWEVREAGLGATAFIPGKPDTYEGWEDSAVPPKRLGEYLRALDELTSRYGYESALYGHYGQGCVHARWNFDLTSAEGLAKFRRFLDEAADLVVSLGGAISGEHGDGQSKAVLLPKMYGDELVEAMRRFKAIWDPDWRMNPGKVVDPYQPTDNLRLGLDYAPAPVTTHFAYPADQGSFAHATTRCVGIGNCRQLEPDGGVMCPSYQVTREEEHSPRGRAHLLWEMLNGGELELWKDDEVLGALDLCLSCKGCSNDCPVSVDIPTLKSEFLAHYYQGRLRPRHAYAFGLIDQGARLGAHAPWLVNAVTQTPGLGRLAKLAAGMAPERQFPRFARLTLRQWFAARPVVNPQGERVLLWADTFNDHFHLPVGQAAVEALESFGYRVALPPQGLCCGRPLYDYGFLDLARVYLERVLDALREEIRLGTPVVGIEPSCLAVFKDELPKILPDDEDGKRLTKQCQHFAQFVADRVERGEIELPRLAGQAILHGHCHHKATGGVKPEQRLLEQMGLEVATPDSGCCGMAGSFGFESSHYDVSKAVGERALLPAVRQAAPEVLIVADGFSCKTQIEQETSRRALHLAEAIRLAQSQRELPAYPERRQPAVDGGRPGPVAIAALLTAGALAGGAWAWSRR